MAEHPDTKRPLIKCGRGHGYHESISDVRRCYNGEDVPAYDGYPFANWKQHEFSGMREADAAVMPENQPENHEDGRTPVELTPGIYYKNGVVYKVQKAVHGSGHMYAKKLDVKSIYSESPYPGGGRFVYVPGAVRKLRPEHRMTKKQAAEYGALYGVCANCGRVLTNETSIEVGMGPVCRSKFV